MITKWVASLALAIIILASLALPASAQGPVDLELGGEGATSWNIGNMMPGGNGTKTVTLHNAGSRNGFVTLWVSDIVSGEGTNPESETGDTAEPGELDHYLLFNISCNGLDSNINLPTTIDSLPQSATDPDFIKISPLKVGDTITLGWQWQLPVEVDNEVQGDSLSFTINYMLEEFPPPSSGWWAPSPPRGTTDVRGMVSTAGRFYTRATANSEDGLCTLTIPAGTVGLTAELEPLTTITMLIMDDPPPPPEAANVIGLIYNFQPRGATFEPPVTLTFTYDPDNIPEGIAEQDLVLAYYDEAAGEWINLEGKVDPETNTITVLISHFTSFTILGYEVLPAAFTPVPAIPSLVPFIPDKVVISPTEVDIGEMVTIAVSVTNTGTKCGIYKVTLKINGAVEAIEELKICPGVSREVSFTTSKEAAGSYKVDVNELGGSFTVKEEVAPAPPAPPPPAPPKVKPINWPLVGGIIAAAIVAGLAIFFLIRRRAL